MDYGNIIKNTFKKFCIPTSAATMSMAVMSILNIIFASLFFGRNGSFTVGLALPVIIFTDIVTYFFGVGGGIAISIKQGKGDMKDADGIFSFALLFTLLAGVLSALLGLLCTSRLLYLFGAKTIEQQNMAGPYIKALMVGMPVIFLANVLNVLVRNDNSPRFAMAGAAASVAVNLLLVYIFISRLKMPIQYVAISTVISQAAAVFIYIGYFFSGESTLKLSKSMSFSSAKDIFQPGFAGSMIFLVQTILTVMINNVLLNTSGTAGIAAYGVVKYAITLVYAVYDSVNHSAQPMFGVYYGEKDNESIKLTAKTAYKSILACSVLLSTLLFITAPYFKDIFAVDVTTAVRITALSCPFSASVAFLNAYYRAAGKSKLSLLLIVLDNLIFPAVLIILFIYGFKWTSNGIWTALMMSEVLTLALILLLSGGNLLLLSDSGPDRHKIYQALIVNNEADIVALNEEIESFCNRNNIDGKKQYYIFLCIEEIAVNIIKYGFSDGKEHYIDIRIMAQKDVVLNIRDDAVKFDPTLKKNADVTVSAENREIGGLGIYLVKKVAREFSYKRVIGFNNLHIVL